MKPLIPALAAMLALAGLGVSHAATTTVTMTENSFWWNSGSGTRVSRIKVGDTLTWENQGQQFHDVTFQDGGSGPIGRNGTWSRTFNVAGTYEYVCTLHEVEGMTGRVVVGGAGQDGVGGGAEGARLGQAEQDEEGGPACVLAVGRDERPEALPGHNEALSA